MTKPAELRKQLIHTIQAMASSPLELREHKKQAVSIARRSCGLVWTSFCSVCGMHFETLGGLHNLASHAGIHAQFARANRLRRD